MLLQPPVFWTTKPLRGIWKLSIHMWKVRYQSGPGEAFSQSWQSCGQNLWLVSASGQLNASSRRTWISALPLLKTSAVINRVRAPTAHLHPPAPTSPLVKLIWQEKLSSDFHSISKDFKMFWSVIWFINLILKSFSFTLAFLIQTKTSSVETLPNTAYQTFAVVWLWKHQPDSRPNMSACHK